MAESKYNAAYHDDWAWSLAMKGAIDEEIAEAFGISRRQLLRWKKKYPSFAEALKKGKDITDAAVEKKLYEKTQGYDYEEKRSIMELDENGNRKPLKVETIKKHIPPDTMACMYWLNNRRRGEWSQRQDVNLSGEVKSGPNLENISDEDLELLAQELRKANGKD